MTRAKLIPIGCAPLAAAALCFLTVSACDDKGGSVPGSGTAGTGDPSIIGSGTSGGVGIGAPGISGGATTGGMNTGGGRGGTGGTTMRPGTGGTAGTAGGGRGGTGGATGAAGATGTTTPPPATGGMITGKACKNIDL